MQLKICLYFYHLILYSETIQLKKFLLFNIDHRIDNYLNKIIFETLNIILDKSQMFRGSTYSMQPQAESQNHSASNTIEYELKIALIGVSNVGKTSLVHCLLGQEFNEDITNTNSVNLRFCKFSFLRYVVNIHIWDAAGDQMLNYIKNQHLKHIDGIIFVFDLTDEQSLYHLQNLIFEIVNKNNITGHLSMVLVGNKHDLVHFDQKNDKEGKQNLVNYIAKKVADRNSLKYFRVSAKQNSFVTDAIAEIIKDHLKHRRNVRTSRLQEKEEQVNVKCQMCQNCIIF